MRKLVVLVYVYVFLSVLQSIFTLWFSFTLTSYVSGTVGLNVLQPCSIKFYKGWNLFSVCAQPQNLSVEHILKDIDYRYVLRWNRSRQEFDIYSPRTSQNPFDSFDLNESYFIYFKNDSGWLEISGDEFGDMNISLLVGWNAPTYPYTFSTNISRYLDGINWRYLMKWNTSRQEFDIFSNHSATKPFWLIYKGEGQFILMQTEGMLKYNKSYLQS
ncbi:MAG: hypothetical protein QXP39_00925 [Candidatus Aenigmatarchaeota archaeon]